MIKHILSVLFAGLVASTLVVVGNTAFADEAQEPEQLACPAGSSRLAVKIAGTASGYPASCALQVCRSAGKVAIKTHIATDPLCNPVLGSCTYVATDWKYQVQTGAEPANHCPTDVLAGPWN